MAQRKSASEYRKKKELEEARKAGTVPAEVDEEGNEINPHIPDFIKQAPWYLSTGAPSLKHQRQLDAQDAAAAAGSDDKWYKRGAVKAQRARKFRKGACTNCGAMSHLARDCLERPRAVGARWTGKGIAADEVVQDLKLGYVEKRDRWNGYDAKQHKEVMQRHELLEAERRRHRMQQQVEALAKGGDAADAALASADLSDDEEDAERASRRAGGGDTEQNDNAFSSFDARKRISVRNLRIREDTAKYLRNLDPDSAFYDPKTRSMRQNPTPDDPDALYKGDNFVKSSGDVSTLAQQQLFAWQAADRGQDVHLQAAPSQVELVHKQFLDRKEKLKKQQQSKLLETYGGQEHLKPVTSEQLAATEAYVEYTRDGKVAQGFEKAVPKTKYAEDVFPGNHTSVWGSYWCDGKWGYACCHQRMRAAYCTGEAGKKAAAGPGDQILAAAEEKRRQRQEADTAALATRGANKRSVVQRDAHGQLAIGDKVTEADMEEYQRKRPRFDDPMAKYVDPGDADS